MMKATIKKNDKKAAWLIVLFSVVVFAAVVVLGKVKLNIDLGFDVHIFAAINAILNSSIAVLLIIALWAVKSGKYELHKNVMITALVLSVLFLISYIAHHLLSGDTKFGGEGLVKIFYLVILITHIILAAIILPFILYTAYRALTAEFDKHKKLAKYTWPLWFYIAVTGPIIYLMIKPYYH